MTQYSNVKNFINYVQGSTPSNPIEDELWYDTNNRQLFIYTSNNEWKKIATVFIAATADFIVDDDTTDTSHAVQFTDKSLGDIVSWSWDFGDGNTSNIQNPTHQYSSPGQYTVSLTMTNTVNTQDTRTITNFITVANDPGANFIASTIADHINANIQFIDQSTSNGTIISWQWDFGDGNTSNIQNPTHQYSSPGQYTVSLTVTDEFGSDMMTRTNYIAIDVPPTAEFISDKQVINASQSIQFIDKSIFHGTVKSWLWDFGDGTTSILQFPVHRYISPGQYTASLTVTDEYGSNTETSPNHIVVNINGTGYEYGYCISGSSNPNVFTIIDRIIFPFDSGTATHVGNSNTTHRGKAACNSSNYGYEMGGNVSFNFSTISRMTFPFDSGTTAHIGNLSNTRSYSAGCNNSRYGYCMGGHDNLSSIDRIIFPFDSGTSNHVGNLSSNIAAETVGCNSSNYGYCMSGWKATSVFLSTVDRITFPFDFGIADHTGNLSENKRSGIGCNSSNYGYYIMGHNGLDRISTIDRITFPFDSGTATHVGNLTFTGTYAAGCNSTNYGYSMGGWNSTDYSIIDRITFPFDSGIAVHIGNLSGSRHACAGCDGTDFVTLFV